MSESSKVKISGTFDPETAAAQGPDLINSPFQEGMVMLDGRKKVTLYQKCLNGVCIKESGHMDMSFKGATGKKDPGDIIRVPGAIGIGEGSANRTVVQCFKMLDLIHAIAQDPAINPLTNQPFDPRILIMLRKRFTKEIKFYQYYLQVVRSKYGI